MTSAPIIQTAAGRGRVPGGDRVGARARPGQPAPSWLAALASLTAAGVALPLVYVFVRSVEGGLAGYVETVWTVSTAKLAARTLLLAAGVAALTNAIAIPLAWLVTRTDLPGRRAWAVVAALPLAFPSYVAAFSLVAALGPRGYVQGWLAPLGVERLPELAYGYSGALLALGLFTYPYVFLLLVGALTSIDPALEESSRNLGLGPWATFRRVVLPQLRPQLLSGTLLVVLYTLSDFGAVSIARYDTFTLSIYNAYRGLFDRSAAASLSTLLVFATVAFIGCEALLSRRSRPSRTRPARRAPAVALGAWRWPSLVALSTLALLCLGLPLGVILLWGRRAIAAGAELGFAWRAATDSLAIAAATALVAVVLSLPVAAWSVRWPSPLGRFVERLSTAGFALPGIVIALALVFFCTRYAVAFYQTLPVLVFAYVVRFLPEALAASRSGLAALSPRFEEAARTLGHGPAAVLRRITLPLIRPSLLAGAGLVFLTTIKELPATLILRPIGFETLATRVWSAASEGIYSQAALPALGLVAVTAPSMYLLVIRPALADREAR